MLQARAQLSKGRQAREERASGQECVMQGEGELGAGRASRGRLRKDSGSSPEQRNPQRRSATREDLPFYEDGTDRRQHMACRAGKVKAGRRERRPGQREDV